MGPRTSAIIDQTLAHGLFCDTDHTTTYSTLRSQLCHRSYLSDILERYCKKYALPLSCIVEIVASAPKQTLASPRHCRCFWWECRS
jgi:hypothetical protein